MIYFSFWGGLVGGDDDGDDDDDDDEKVSPCTECNLFTILLSLVFAIL